MTEVATAVARAGLRTAVLRGLAWKTASRVLFEVTKLGVAIALARLLTPHEYGLAGMVLVLVAFQPVLSGVALASALVQRPELTEDDRSTVFWTNAATGLLFTVLGVALSGPAADFYGDSAVQPLFAAMSLCYFISALGVTHSQLLVRDMDFRSLELRSMAGIVVGAVLAVVAAARGYGAWALVVQQLGTFATSTVLLWTFSDWHPRLRYSRDSIRELRGFGGNVSGTLLLFQANENVDNVLIGRFLGAAALGPYALAYNIILVPFSRLTAPLHDVLYPVFTRLQHDLPRMASVWLRVARLMLMVALPSMLALAVVAPDFVTVVFGARWDAAAPVVRILSWVGVLLALQGLNSLLFLSVGRTGVLLAFAVVSFAGGLVSFLVGLQWGIVGVAACFASWSTVMQLVYLRLAAQTVECGLRGCWRALAGVVQVGLIVAGTVALARALAQSADASAVVRLLVASGSGAAVLLPACAWRAPGVIEELRALLRRRSDLA
jgi:O-antigen/teichoic acid export membrane protein